MQLTKPERNKFDAKKIEQLILSESRFITNLLTISAIPERRDAEEDEESDPNNPQKRPLLLNGGDKKTRATSLHELEERLKAITSKKKLSYKEKLAKKNLKNRMKKKSKQDVRNAELKLKRAAKQTVKNEEIKPDTNTPEVSNEKKPVFNSENKLVFSKIDFANLGKKKVKKQEKDPEKLLNKLKEQKSKLEQLEQSGETHKVLEIKEKTAWKNALAKAEGQKVKDDPILLKKSVDKKEQKIRSSKKKWEARIQGVQKSKDEKQKKRKENIDKRKKDKKVKKLKGAAKRGKIIPGF
ncbi:surfeit locus protein 6 homolog [Anthonomus grandis grandis]|uniref:surfeit locus protein 6 homolog n=1 Tax=Anthonomus grandis grandis TaxID=2921223 RepID=UPI002165AAAF|nr:surfeit locus protein 6 homolog [Anthonomus grandis grandis]